MIRHIILRGDVAIRIGSRGIPADIRGYDHEKHHKDLDVEQREGFVYLYPLLDGKRTGIRKKVPMSSIAYIDETDEKPEKVKP